LVEPWSHWAESPPAGSLDKPSEGAFHSREAVSLRPWRALESPLFRGILFGSFCCSCALNDALQVRLYGVDSREFG